MEWSPSWRPNPPPRTGAGTVRPTLIPGRGDTLVGSWPARWPPDWSLLSSSPPPRSSRPRNVPSRALSCAGSRWAGRCWRCSRCGSPISRSDGPRLLRCSWWGLAPRWTRCWTGCSSRCKAYPMPGQLIDVGGHRLHLSCTGSGTPTVVLEPGAGEMSSSLGWIAPAVARNTRVCVYDRAGRGWSEPASTAQDGAQIATDLHTLLQRGHVPGPYVLAGHSFGGLYVLTFTARYPDEVAGMVLVDSTAPASPANPGMPSSGHGGSSNGMSRVSALVSTAARLGLGRLYGRFAFGSLPP